MITDTTIAVASFIISVFAALFAWFTFKATEKTNNITILQNLYETYRSNEVLRDLQIVWSIYHKLWHDFVKLSGIEENKEAEEDNEVDKMENKPDNADKGLLLPDQIAKTYFLSLEKTANEYTAIHNMINFWTYIQLLLRRKIISPKEILAFTSPRILGFLCPIQEAYEFRFKQGVDKSANLEYSYKRLRVGQNH